ncbi:hypothetical protein [Desulfatitalea alkaliphila]|uniref:Uncharacterized protein n=1 Tax=Desulfatitalea alkaliphila TaxID=2929485 RepID=A0AA41UJ01_9BACT|nr:hypothetical protein [Desulfatitalea alkaliphila]MCJ8500067.1 hypothetical protein [Desulfatitalea alkaliphila]
MKVAIHRILCLLPALLAVGALVCSPFAVGSALADKRSSIFDWSNSSEGPTAFGYMIAYSYRDKIVYFTPIISQRAPETSFNDEEYVFQTSTVLKLERAFQKKLEQEYKIRSADFTFNARVVYKTERIALNRFFRESNDFRIKAFKLVEVSDFRP